MSHSSQALLPNRWLNHVLPCKLQWWCNLNSSKPHQISNCLHWQRMHFQTVRTLSARSKVLRCLKVKIIKTSWTFLITIHRVTRPPRKAHRIFCKEFISTALSQHSCWRSSRSLHHLVNSWNQKCQFLQQTTQLLKLKLK